MATDILEVLGVRPVTSDDKPKPAMFANPFSFNGRIRRAEYGLSIVFYLIMYVQMMGFIIGPYARYEYEGRNPVGFLIVAVPVLWFIWAQGAKRCHDLGNSGWYQLIPLYGLWMLFQNGQKGPNEYGENPKGEKSDTELSF